MKTANSSLPILLIDDDPTWMRGFRHNLILSLHAEKVLLCEDSRKALQVIAKEVPAVVVLDVTMPYIGGEELLAKIIEKHPALPVIMLTGRNQLELAVECMKLGAYDYCVKTDELERLVGSVRHALQLAALERQNHHLRKKVLTESLTQPEAFSEIVTGDRSLFAMFRYLEAIADSDEPLLIRGESGTGKELIARALHNLAFTKKPFVAINVAGLDDQMFSDTLFGHRRGAFTGAQETRSGLIEQAKDGLLFLDEIGDLGVSSQIKLLRLLQEGEFLPLGSDRPVQSYCRIVCATNRDLESGLVDEWFRSDLYYRLRTHQVILPPLRERRGDISLLLRYFWAKTGVKNSKKFDKLPSDIISLLTRYDYPGNVRELRGMVFDVARRMLDPAFSAETLKTVFNLPELQPLAPQASGDTLLFGEGYALPTLNEVVWLTIEEALLRSGGNQAQAARMLGISRAALNKRLKTRNEEVDR
ncbi:MAG: sigma-54-dependent Fis family transcriptional regulator [Desulfuromonadales bacterium]|nr:sigma-54-dependent Fis family transcriptional regulator [Desulfuromonadales bacterium]